MAVSVRDYGVAAGIGVAGFELAIETLNGVAQNLMKVSLRDVGVSFLKAGGGASLYAIGYPLMMKIFEHARQIIGISADEVRDVDKKMSERIGFFKLIVIAPIVEEVICREILQKNFEFYYDNSTWSQIGSVLLVSSFFGAMHLLNLKAVISIVNPALAGKPVERQWMSLSGKYVKFQAIAAVAAGVGLGVIKNFSGLGICGSIGAHAFTNACAYFGV